MVRQSININSLCKTYRGSDRPAIDSLSLSVPAGEVFGLLGPNGAGKTTLIGILCGLRSFDSGELSILGRELPGELKAIKPLIGVVPQDIALFPTLTAYENLKVIGRIFGIGSKELKARIDGLLEVFGLDSCKHRRVETYSGGMKRRVNLIAGLLHSPEIIFLDEPTAGVDVQSKRLIIDRLKDVNAAGSTIVYTSHYMEEAENICTTVAFIDEGRIICQGRPSEMVREAGCASLEELYLKLTGKELRQ